MTGSSIALRLRSVTVRIDYTFTLCGPDCLLGQSDSFIAALPAGMGVEAGSGFTAANLLFETPRATLVKHRRHLRSGQTSFFGAPFAFDWDRQQRAFAVLRNERPAGISIPGQECACSYEASYHPGKLLLPPASFHTRHLAQKYPARRMETAREAVQFVAAAWTLLTTLHGLGIQHGDPSFYNFLETDAGLTLIDLDDLMLSTGGGTPAWDFGVFLLQTFIPAAGGFLPPSEMLALGRDLFGESAAGLFTSAFHSEWLPVLLSSEMSGMRAVDDLRQLETSFEATRLFEEELLSKALFEPALEEARQELATKETEIDNLSRSAAERLAALEEAHQSLAEKDASLRGLARDLEAKEGEIRSLAAAAEERLRLIQTLDLELKSRAAVREP